MNRGDSDETHQAHVAHFMVRSRDLGRALPDDPVSDRLTTVDGYLLVRGWTRGWTPRPVRPTPRRADGDLVPADGRPRTMRGGTRDRRRGLVCRWISSRT